MKLMSCIIIILFTCQLSIEDKDDGDYGLNEFFIYEKTSNNVVSNGIRGKLNFRKVFVTFLEFCAFFAFIALSFCLYSKCICKKIDKIPLQNSDDYQLSLEVTN